MIESTGRFVNLEVHDDKLYATGNFHKIGTTALSGVAVWDDTLWSSFLGLDSIIASGWSINDLEFYKGDVYVSGNFVHPEQPQIHDIMMHDGQSWKPVGNFRTDGLGDVRKMLVWRDTLYIAGLIRESSGAPGNCVAAWDGQQWHRLQDGLRTVGTAAATDLIVHNGELWVCGYFYIVNGRYVDHDYAGVAKWDGSRWCTMGMRKQGTLQFFGKWKEELFLVGEFIMDNDPDAMRIVKWIGGSYTDTCSQNPLSLGDDKKAAMAMLLYPNPATNILHIELPSSGFLTNSSKIIFTDQTGRVNAVQQSSVMQIDNKTIALDIQHLAVGIYVVELFLQDKKYYGKLTKKD